MRTFCIIAISFIISLPLAGQSKLDKIVYQNGKEIEVFIVRNLDETIECTYPGEEMVTVIPKSKLEKIIFRSGREEIINTLTSSETSIYELKEFDRMRQIKAHGAIGFAGSTFALKKSMKGVETIPVSIILSSAVKDRLSNENVFLEQAIRIFVEKAKIGKTGFTPKTDDSASLYAVFSILSMLCSAFCLRTTTEKSMESLTFTIKTRKHLYVQSI